MAAPAVRLACAALALRRASTFAPSPPAAAFDPASGTRRRRRRTRRPPASALGDGSGSWSEESSLTDWVVENLEGDGEAGQVGGTVTAESDTMAGEGDTIPPGGLRIGPFRITPAGTAEASDGDDGEAHDDDGGGDPVIPIRLLVGRNGWGTGVHPTTRLCLEFLSLPGVLSDGGGSVLDYGCGSGVLSAAALGLGASRAVGVDVEAEALISSERNLDLNGFGDRFEGMHVREVLPRSLFRPGGADVCVANILIGQLVRPSMVTAIVTNLAPGGWLCLSGIRPDEVGSLKSAYGEYVEWEDDRYAELAASDTEGSVESYGYDVGTWSRLVGRVREGGGMDVEAMSELAVS